MRLNRHLRHWLAKKLKGLRPVIESSAATCHAERYRKHFHAFSHACLLLFHGLSGGRSLRQSYIAFTACTGLVALSGLGQKAFLGAAEDDVSLGVSYSQFAASNTTRSAAFLSGLLRRLMREVHEAGLADEAGLPAWLHLMDATFLRLSVRLAPWLGSGASSTRRSGMRLQVQYWPASDEPEQTWLTDWHVTDYQALDHMILHNPKQLEALQEHTLAFDLGYYSHTRLAALLAAQIHFVTRRHCQAKLQVEADLPISQPLPGMPPPAITVLRDQRVTVGSKQHRDSVVLAGLRLVTARVEPRAAAARQGAQAKTYTVLTDRMDLESSQVVQAYRWRWQIELFFRWMKSHVHLDSPLGYSHNAIAMSVYLALIVHLLTVLAAHHLGLKRRTPTLLHCLALVLIGLRPREFRIEQRRAKELSFGCGRV